MRLNKPLEQKGWFRLSDQEGLISGILRVAENGRTTIELMEAPGDFRAVSGIEDPSGGRLLGTLENGEPVTLDGCAYLNLNFGYIPRSLVRVGQAYIGHAYEMDEPIAFSRLRFSVEGLDQWLNQSLGRIQSDDEGVTVRYSNPPEIKIRLSESLTLSFGWDRTMQYSAPSSSNVSIVHQAYLELESDAPLAVDELLRSVFKINNFMCFALDETVTLNLIMAFSNNITMDIGNETFYEVPIKIYSQTLPYSDEPPDVQWQDMLLGYPPIASRLEDIFLRWMEYYDSSQPVIGLYMASQLSKGAYVERTFLSVIQALEVMHRRRSTETEMPADQFNAIVIQVVDACPEQHRKWLKGRLKYANELSLRKRLHQLVAPFAELYGGEDERKAFIAKCVASRNYLTHYDKSFEKEALGLRELWVLCQKLEALCQMHLLSTIGFDKESVVAMAKQPGALKRRLSGWG